ncbi:hypothetical protein Pla175_41300 [Pirellulimonas nuda]|uniref:Uncharacterized protein n=1 Tax=Pirellulimonas nuda TaxID=2528009 RepID=A0A518DGW6_9BACT|nr:hypothetical protein Pla175_41300 [Pirellulimonas nuda]
MKPKAESHLGPPIQKAFSRSPPFEQPTCFPKKSARKPQAM